MKERERQLYLGDLEYEQEKEKKRIDEEKRIRQSEREAEQHLLQIEQKFK